MDSTGLIMFALSNLLFLVSRNKLAKVAIVSQTQAQATVAAAMSCISVTDTSTGGTRTISAMNMPLLRPPPVLHKTMRKPDIKDKVIIIGDIHGCLDEFKSLLIKCEFDPLTCTVVLVGDLVNKGPHSAEIVRYCREMGVLSVRGNHDEAALRVVCRGPMDEEQEVSSFEGLTVTAPPVPQTTVSISAKYQYVLEWSPADVDWLLDLPYTLCLPDFGAIVVHAGLAPGVFLPAQQPCHMTCMRTVKPNVATDAGVDNSTDEEGPYSVLQTPVSISGVGAQPWAEVWSAADAQDIVHGYHVYFGHDAAKGLQQCAHATGLDTGCCYGRNLTAAMLPGGHLVSVSALRQYVIPASD